MKRIFETEDMIIRLDKIVFITKAPNYGQYDKLKDVGLEVYFGNHVVVNIPSIERQRFLEEYRAYLAYLNTLPVMTN